MRGAELESDKARVASYRDELSSTWERENWGKSKEKGQNIIKLIIKKGWTLFRARLAVQGDDTKESKGEELSR